MNVKIELADSASVISGPVLNLVSTGTTGTTTNKIVYLEEVVKPDFPTQIDFTKRVAPIEKVAVFLPVGSDMLKDLPALTAYANERGLVFLRQALNRAVYDKIRRHATVLKHRPFSSFKRTLKRATKLSKERSLLPGTVAIVGGYGDETMVGNFREGVTVWTKGGATAEASDSHQDYFRQNLAAVRIEQRLAVIVHRPSSFILVKGPEK